MASSRGEGHCWRQGRHGVRSACGFVSRRPPLPSPAAQEMPDQVGHDGARRDKGQGRGYALARLRETKTTPETINTAATTFCQVSVSRPVQILTKVAMTGDR